ncbi:MAG: hypothetical protein ABEJ43_02580 [Haloferacaceae archaeon]
MELRSCYFCGVAGRTVESRDLGAVAVTLCPRCEEKLARLRDATDAGATETTPVTFDGSDDAGHSTDADGEEPTARTADEPPDQPAADGPGDETDGAPSDGPPDESGSSDDAGSTGLRGLDSDDRGRRSTYRKALRLLRNREFPMARSDTVDLLASAYDLDREECERLLDLCVDRGLLAEENGELREP